MTKDIEYRIGKYLLTNRTTGARYGFPVLHDTETGREYGPGDVLPRAVLLGRFPSPTPQTAGDAVRRWRDQQRDDTTLKNTDPARYAEGDSGPARTPEEVAAADLFLSQLGSRDEN